MISSTLVETPFNLHWARRPSDGPHTAASETYRDLTGQGNTAVALLQNHRVSRLWSFVLSTDHHILRTAYFLFFSEYLLHEIASSPTKIL